MIPIKNRSGKIGQRFSDQNGGGCVGQYTFAGPGLSYLALLHRIHFARLIIYHAEFSR
jgi:hypothetical protein